MSILSWLGFRRRLSQEDRKYRRMGRESLAAGDPTFFFVNILRGAGRLSRHEREGHFTALKRRMERARTAITVGSPERE